MYENEGMWMKSERGGIGCVGGKVGRQGIFLWSF